MASRASAHDNGIPTVLRVEIDADVCMACEACVVDCPEVFEMQGGQVGLREDAPYYYQSKAEEILTAEGNCPVEAIWAITAPPRPSPPGWRGKSSAARAPGKTVVEMLGDARDVAEGRTPTIVRKPWWKFW